jgi:hypothetical protein
MRNISAATRPNQECIRTCLRLGVSFTFTAHDGWTNWKSHIKDIDDWESWKWSDDALETFEAKRQEGQDQGLFDGETAGGYWDYYGVVTNISLYWNTKQQVVERHNKRGNAENFIKEEPAVLG